MNSLTPTEYDAAVTAILNDAGVPAELQPAIRRGIDRACTWDGALTPDNICRCVDIIDAYDVYEKVSRWMHFNLNRAFDIAFKVETISP
jgi:hypothetical protein